MSASSSSRLGVLLLQLTLLASRPQPLLAQSENLSWAQAIQETARNNAELKAAQENLRATEQGVRVSRAGYYPEVGASVGGNYGQTRTPGQPEELNEARDSYSASLSVSQSLFSGWADQARVNQAKATVNVASLQLNVEKARLSSELKAAYAGLLLAQRTTQLQEDIIRRRQENLRLVELRFESGRENKGSVLLSQAYLDQSRFEAIQAQNSLRVAQAELARILGRDQGGPIKASEEVPSSAPSQRPDFRQLAQKVPELKQSQFRQEGAAAEVVAARAPYFPTLSLSGNLGRQGPEWFPDSEAWSLGLTLSYPLFSGGRDKASHSAALSRLNAAEAQRLNLERDLLARLEQSYASWVEANEAQKVEASFRQAALTRAEIARNKYNNGLLSFEDWDLIESELVARQRSFLTSQRQRVVAEANWERIQGRGVIP